MQNNNFIFTHDTSLFYQYGTNSLEFNSYNLNDMPITMTLVAVVIEKGHIAATPLKTAIEWL